VVNNTTLIKMSDLLLLQPWCQESLNTVFPDAHKGACYSTADIKDFFYIKMQIYHYMHIHCCYITLEVMLDYPSLKYANKSMVRSKQLSWNLCNYVLISPSMDMSHVNTLNMWRHTTKPSSSHWPVITMASNILTKLMLKVCSLHSEKNSLQWIGQVPLT